MKNKKLNCIYCNKNPCGCGYSINAHPKGCEACGQKPCKCGGKFYPEKKAKKLARMVSEQGPEYVRPVITGALSNSYAYAPSTTGAPPVMPYGHLTNEQNMDRLTNGTQYPDHPQCRSALIPYSQELDDDAITPLDHAFKKWMISGHDDEFNECVSDKIKSLNSGPKKNSIKNAILKMIRGGGQNGN